MNKVILLTVFYILGLILGNIHYSIIFGLILIFFGLIYRKNIKNDFIVALIFALSLGILNYQIRNNDSDKLSEIEFANNATIVGRITTVPEFIKEKDKIRFYFRVNDGIFDDKKIENINCKTFVTINNPKNIGNIKIGNVVEIKGKLRTPTTSSNPYQFDYAKYLKRKGVFSTFYSDGENIKLIKRPDFSFSSISYKILNKLDKSREKIIAHHAKYVKSPNLEILAGIVFGDETINPTEDVKEKFKNSGLLHLLAASGLNVALIFGIWWFIGIRIRLGSRLTIISGIALIILYSIMTGLPPSILRASLMLLFVLVGKLFDVEADSLSLVFLVGLILLIINPNMLYDIGFQLSFVVTIGLIYGCEKLGIILEPLDKKYKNFVENKKDFLKMFSPKLFICTILTPLIAQLSVLPFQLHYFNTITPYSLGANICIIPFISVASFLGFISSIFSIFNADFIVKILDKMVNPFIEIIIKISEIFSNLKGAILYFPSPNFVQIILYFCILFLVFAKISDKFHNKKKNAVLIILSFILLLGCIKIPDKTFKIFAFDVGNSDSFLIKTPKNKIILIDTGKLPYKGKSQAEFIINRYLRNENIRKIDFLILSHFDIDHVGGIIDIKNNFKLGKTFIENTKADNLISKKFLSLEKNVQKANNNEIIYKEKDLQIKTFVDKSAKENDASVIVLIEYKGQKALFMGDASAKIYRKLEKYIPKNINILKVGHHGAKGSVDDYMLEKLRANYAIISTGTNHYGHPHFETLEKLRKHKVLMLSTKELGAIEFEYSDKNKDFKINTFKK